MHPLRWTPVELQYTQCHILIRVCRYKSRFRKESVTYARSHQQQSSTASIAVDELISFVSNASHYGLLLFFFFFLPLYTATYPHTHLSIFRYPRQTGRQAASHIISLFIRQSIYRYAYNSNKILIYCLRATITIKIKPCGTRTCAVKIAQTLLNNNSTPKKNYGGRHIHNTYPSHSYIHVHSWKPRFLRTTEWILFVAGKL